MMLAWKHKRKLNCLRQSGPLVSHAAFAKNRHGPVEPTTTILAQLVARHKGPTLHFIWLPIVS